MALPNFISGVFGVTEPAIYGILLPLKKPFIISCITGGIGGEFYGFFNLRKFMVGGMGIFELPAMIEPDGAMGNLIVALFGIVISMVVGFVLTMIFYKDKEEVTEVKEVVEENNSEDKSNSLKKIVISSPIKGETIKLEDIEDAAFATGVLGQGLAIKPTEGKVVAPVSGEVTTLFPSLHAIGITSDEGVEILIHVGLDTVQLEGKGFKAHVKQGDKIVKGQELVTFDIDFIQKSGYSIVTPVVVTNYNDYFEIAATESKNLELGDKAITVII